MAEYNCSSWNETLKVRIKIYTCESSLIKHLGIREEHKHQAYTWCDCCDVDIESEEQIHLKSEVGIIFCMHTIKEQKTNYRLEKQKHIKAYCIDITAYMSKGGYQKGYEEKQQPESVNDSVITFWANQIIDTYNHTPKSEEHNSCSYIDAGTHIGYHI